MKNILTKFKVVDWLLLMFLVVLVGILLSDSAFAASIKLPGTDSSDKLEAAGTLLRMVDTALFKWGARIFAGTWYFISRVAFKGSAIWTCSYLSYWINPHWNLSNVG